ncbi:hypothetical protein FOXG_19608 [Fusarium oxysporum f. sp. lycopersici 4287]|uniref:Uncharacterized protein n=1 Tax=Fusarium oxysporum f. sp. lycopersici (strain 4287 / CBS 123668 / FGSC 9935 / NRRL 34936) TaxID=426428 RepID=A0A0J9V528_FUSO4|nr:hypothetical protein FOXG_19608 [Fusarium oxysporum f. sp. lycopersici 4287]KNB06238.1 hypothetical protein FOXG_19608 [Fusarium oxysporum f. sp. lycopersici 4287]
MAQRRLFCETELRKKSPRKWGYHKAIDRDASSLGTLQLL